MKKIIFVCISMMFMIEGCAKEFNLTSSNEQVKEQQINSNAIQEMINQKESDYQYYSGVWSGEGVSHEYIIENGGIEFQVEIVNNNELKGFLYLQQGSSERFAEIDDISCNVENGECYYYFSDDGWGNRGTLFIQFKKNRIEIEVQDFVLSNINTSGFGINGSYVLMRELEQENGLDMTVKMSNSIPSIQQYHSTWTDERIQEELLKRKEYLQNCSYYGDILHYIENVREIRDIAMFLEPMYATNIEEYSKDDFIDIPPLIIYIAKNEIYARHGYIFRDKDLLNYFMGQLWYVPYVKAEEFDTSVFSEREKKNLELLVEIDTYKK